MADIQITADYSDLQLIQRELVNVQGQARKSASVFEREFNKVERDLRKSATAAQKYYNELLGVDRGHKSAQTSARTLATALKEQEKAERDSIAAIKQKEQAVENLKLKYNPLYAAMVQYDNKLEELNMAHREGAISIRTYEAELEKLNTEFNQFKTGTAGWSNQFVQGSTRAAKSTNQLGVVTQQAGYQVGDFLVQVQSGTNWMVAFGQQATQLVGILPLLSGSIGVSAGTLVALSAGLGIAIPLVTAIGAAWMRTSKDTNEASDSVKELNSQLKSIDSTLQDWIDTKKAAEAGVSVEELIGGRGLAQATENLRLAREELNKFTEATEGLGAFVTGAGFLDISEAIASLWGGDAASQYIATLENVMAAENRLADLRRKQAEENFSNFSQERNDLLDQISLLEIAGRYGEESVQYIEEEARQRRVAYGVQVEQMEITEAQKASLQRTYDLIVDSTTATESFKIKMAGVADEAARLATNMEGSAAAWAQFRSDQVLASIGPGMTTGDGIDLLDIEAQGLGGFLPPAWGNDRQKGAPKPKRSVGRSRKEDTGIGSFAQSLLDEQDQLEAWRTDAMAKLEEFNAMELEVLGGHANAKLLIEEEYQRKKQELQQAERDRSLSIYGDLFGNMAALAKAGGEKTFAVWKAFSIAQATIDSYRAYTQVLADPFFVGRPFMRAIAAGSVLAGGLAQVANIASTSIGGGSKGSSGGGRGGGGISTPTAQAQAAPQQVLIQGLQSGMRLTPEEIQEIFDQVYKENKERGTIFKIDLS